MSAPASGRGGYCIGCGRKSPCKQTHNEVERARLAAEAELEERRAGRRRWGSAR
jgi:hypothetical protein